MDAITKGKQLAGYAACESIRDGMKIGLGTGSTAFFAIERVAQLIQEGMRLQALATSEQTAALARERGIPLLDIRQVQSLDLTIDGVDEIDPHFHAIKGGGGALFREKIVALLAKEIVWVMDESKQVEMLGEFPLPLEVLPFGVNALLARLDALQLKPRLRLKKGHQEEGWSEVGLKEQLRFLQSPKAEQTLWWTDNGNLLIDLHTGAPLDLRLIEREVLPLTGVLESGLFLNLCSRIYVGGEKGVQKIVNEHPQPREVLA